MDRNSTRLRLPKGLHDHLRATADAQDVSLNTLLATLLAGAVGWKLEPDDIGAASASTNPPHDRNGGTRCDAPTVPDRPPS